MEPTTFTDALRAALRAHTRRQRVILGVLVTGGLFLAAGVAAGSYPIGFLGAALAFGALTQAKS